MGITIITDIITIVVITIHIIPTLIGGMIITDLIDLIDGTVQEFM